MNEKQPSQMDELFKTHKLYFDTENNFNAALSLNPNCIDIGYSDRILSFKTIKERIDFKTKLTESIENEV